MTTPKKIYQVTFDCLVPQKFGVYVEAHDPAEVEVELRSKITQVERIAITSIEEVDPAMLGMLREEIEKATIEEAKLIN